MFCVYSDSICVHLLVLLQTGKKERSNGVRFVSVTSNARTVCVCVYKIAFE